MKQTENSQNQRPLDRRQRRTRRLLSGALLDLIEEKGFAPLTIQEITDRADLNRATFYLHYGSKEELLADSLKSRFTELVEGLAEISIEHPIWADDMAPVLAFQHAADNIDLYRLLLNDTGAGYVGMQIIEFIARFSLEQLSRSLPPEVELNIPPAIISYQVAGSLLALIWWWVNEDMPLPPEEMGRIAHQMCISGTMPFLDGEVGTINPGVQSNIRSG